MQITVDMAPVAAYGSISNVSACISILIDVFSN